MTTITLATIERTYANNGQHAEQLLAYTLTGNLRKHDRVPFDKGSDIPEFCMSVKSGGATLMNGNLCTKDTKDGIIEEFITRSVSTCFAFVLADFSVAYVMNAVEFKMFCELFSNTCRDSHKNGGKIKVQIYKESQKMRNWFAEMMAV
jgi:hypothetical protein